MSDLLLEAWVSGLIELAKIEWIMGAGESWKPGEKLKLLFACYAGARNTGSDLRVEEILRQVRRILGEENIELSVMTQNFDSTRGYFGDARQVHLPDIYPPFLRREVSRSHGVVACEGSMFKSKFANALTTMMIGSLGIAAAQSKISVGYGAEAGEMDPLVARMCRRYCRDSLIITRNRESRQTLGELGVSSELRHYSLDAGQLDARFGVALNTDLAATLSSFLRQVNNRAELGTDTAWTFEPHGPGYGRSVLQRAGWDGRAPVLVICPVNPFFWPVKPSFAKWLAHSLFGAYKTSHYRSLYFHRFGAEVNKAYEKYLSSIAAAVQRYRATRNVFVITVGMERLDKDACQRLASKLGGAPVFTSEQYDMFQLVSILRACDRMVSSRYHAILTSMPGGVVSAGVTMDERIRNLMHERGHDHLLLRVDEPDLDEKLFTVMESLDREAEAIREAIARAVAKNLRIMARMGVYFEEHVARCYPEFPVRTGVLGWEDYLPPLDSNLTKLLETHEAAAVA